MRLYWVTERHGDLGDLVIARTGREARALAWRESWHMGFESFIDLRTRWVRDAIVGGSGRVLSWNDPLDAVLIRDAGGFLLDDRDDCYSCGLDWVGQESFRPCATCHNCPDCGHDSDCAEARSAVPA